MGRRGRVRGIGDVVFPGEACRMQLQIPKSFFSSVNRALLSSALIMGLAVGGSLAAQPVHAQVGLPDFTELVEKVGPAVVNIRTTERARAGRGGAGGSEMDEDLLEFFRR